jgi:shikimate dehydrogenase
MKHAPEPTYTLADLEHWPRGVDQWPADGTALAVIGRPVAHSLSPVMHNAALAELAKARPEFSRWRYFKFDIAPGELAGALGEFHRNKFRGLNLTVPHKALVVEHLDLVDPFVREAGAANTLKFTERWWHGSNTDGFGLSAALKEDLAVDLNGIHVILLGAGGAARAAAMECLHGRCSSLWIGNRTEATRNSLLENLRKSAALAHARNLGPVLHLAGFDPKNPPAALPAEAVVINATSLGLKADDESPLDLTTISRPAKVFDMIYRPPQTALLRQAAQLGIPNANGLSMLIHQGARSLELWTGASAPLPIMRAAAQAGLDSN